MIKQILVGSVGGWLLVVGWWLGVGVVVVAIVASGSISHKSR
jgi:hypothetical protein